MLATPGTCLSLNQLSLLHIRQLDSLDKHEAARRRDERDYMARYIKAESVDSNYLMAQIRVFMLASVSIVALVPRAGAAADLNLALLGSGLNPSGLQVIVQRQNDPIHSARRCRVTGCSREICTNQDEITPCIWKPEYSCYKDALCRLQPDGKCGWTMTSKLKACLSRVAASPPGNGNRGVKPPPH